MLYTGRFIALLIIGFFSASNIGTFYLFPVFIADHGGSTADIGYIMGAFSLASVLCRPLISSVINRLGRKKAYVLANVLMLLATMTYLLFSGRLENFYLPLLVVRAVHGVGGGFSLTAGFTYAADIVPSNRMNEGLGIYGCSGLLGFALGPALAELIIRQWSFSAFFPAAAATAAIATLILLFLPESYAHDRRQAAAPFRAVLGRPKIWITALLVVTLGVGLTATNNFVVLFAQSRGISFASSYFVAYSGSAIAARLLGGRVADRVGEARVIPYAMAVCGAGLLLLVFINSVAFLLLAGLISGAAHGMLYPCLTTMAVRDEPAVLRAKILGIVTGSIDLGIFAGAIVLGQVGKYLGFPAIFIIAGMAFFGGLLLIHLRPLKPATSA
ncbi:MAG: MFS transporter [Pseudomonadota bacterium]